MSEQPSISEQAVRERLQAACNLAGSQRRFAEVHGIRESIITDVLHARRPPSEAILAALGLRRVVRYADLRNRNAAVAVVERRAGE